MVDFGSVRFELERGVDLNGGSVVDGGHPSAVHSGGGGVEVNVEGAGKERGALELDGGVKNVGEDDEEAGVGVRESDQGVGAGHFCGIRVDSPADPAGGGNERAGEDKV